MFSRSGVDWFEDSGGSGWTVPGVPGEDEAGFQGCDEIPHRINENQQGYRTNNSFGGGCTVHQPSSLHPFLSPSLLLPSLPSPSFSLLPLPSFSLPSPPGVSSSGSASASKGKTPLKTNVSDREMTRTDASGPNPTLGVGTTSWSVRCVGLP